MKNMAIIFVIFCTLAICSTANARMLDLTDPSAQDTANGAIFIQWTDTATGTGVIDSFVRIQGKDTEAGYNTAGTEQFQTKDSRPVAISDIPLVNFEGSDYRQFLLDVNENSGSENEIISLDALKIHIEHAPDISGYPDFFSAPVYDLGDNWIKLDYTLGAGSGKGDMLALIPDELFPESGWIYLYSEFGRTYPCDAGFEEWAPGPAAANSKIPLPPALLLVTVGITAIMTKKYL